MRVMLFWASLAFFLVAILGSLVVAALRALRLWRTVRGTARRATESIGKVAEAAAAAERRATALTAKSDRLGAAVTHLQESLAELAVIRGAVAESQTLLGALRGAVPRK